jgi:hypothetical protein
MNIGITDIRITFYFKTHIYPRTYEGPVMKVVNNIRKHKHYKSLFLIKQFVDAQKKLVIETESHSIQH